MIDKGIEQTKSRLLIDVPAEDIATKYQGRDGKAGLAKRAFDHGFSDINEGVGFRQCSQPAAFPACRSGC
ncbi:hypothetical protein ACFSQQ_14170 [Mesorhizobium kowhaii]|uniref:hypothetical protein n=1 Tax=Mesorhizobium kowhaii TaxID=1300272 RepID=UPI0035E63637